MLKLAAAGLCRQEATVNLLRQVAKGITGSAPGLKKCSCVSLLLCIMTQPGNAGFVSERQKESAEAYHGCLFEVYLDQQPGDQDLLHL